MRPAVALLITLFFIMMLTILIGRNQEITSNAFQRIEEKNVAIQSIISLKDSIALLEKFTKGIDNAEALEQLFKTPQIRIDDPESGLNITFDFIHGANRIELNNLSDFNQTTKKHDTNEEYYRLLTRILDAYNVLDTTFFLSLLLDTIDIDTEERIAQSEIIRTDPDARQGKIYNYTHFQRILDYYVNLNGDNNIRDIPWKRFFSFHSTPTDFNHMDSELIQYVLPLQTNPEIYDEILVDDFNASGRFRDDERDTLKQLNINTFEPLLNCRYEFNQFGYNYRISFLYDIRTQRAYQFEFQD